jgi:succinoglycan biosynthesis transport protein ExoP
MNVPKLSFDDADGRSRLPSSVAKDSRSITAESRRVLVNFDDEKFDTQGESAPNFRKYFFMYLGLVLKYRWLLLACCVLFLAIGFIVTVTSTPIYQATATIQIDRQAQQVVKLDGAQDRDSTGDDQRFYVTQYDLLRSRSLAERVASDLNLVAASDFLNPPSTSAWGKLRTLIFSSAKPVTKESGTPATKDGGNFEQRKATAAAMVQSGLSVQPVRSSSLVRISFESPSPEWAEQIANGVADSYASANLERRYGASSYARTFLKERLDELKLKLQESEKTLVAYADEKELIDLSGIASSGKSTGNKQSLADSDLAALNTAMQQVVAERIKAQDLWEQANESKGIALPQILDDGAIRQLRAQRAGLVADYQNKLSTFKPAYPDMLRLKAQIDQIDEEIKSSVAIIKQSLKARYESAQQQEQLLKKKMDETKRGVLDTRNKEIQFNILKREADTNRTLYEGLLQQYKDAGVAGAVGTNNVAVIDRAQRPGGPFKPNLRNNLLTWLMMGLAAAACAIALFEIIDDSFKLPEEIEEQLGLAVLGVIPASDRNILAEITGTNPVGEAFRSFRTALQFSTDQGAPKSIAVTSAKPGEGKSTTALALAVNFANLGMKVLLIDADLRNPSQHRNLKRPSLVGLANYLAGGASPEDTIQEAGVDGLYFMPSGPLPPNPAELLAGSRMISFLSSASGKFDTIIIDCPPVLGLADAPLLASMASGTLLVVAAGDTRRGVVKTALKRLHFARARMVGTLINKCNFRTHFGYGYGYGYGYGPAALEYYGYGQNNKPTQVEHSPRA